MNIQWLRLTLTLIAAGCAIVVWQIVMLMNATGHASILMRGVAVGVSLAGVTAAALTFAPRRLLQRLCDTASSLLSTIRSTQPIDDRHSGLLLMGLGVVLYAALIGWMLSLPNDPSDDDQGAFLQTAATVHDAGGPLHLIADLYGARFSEANRHPLYIALLSWRPTDEFGRGLSAALGLMTLLSLTLFTARMRGTLVAGIACVLLATNMAFCLFSTRIVCDVLMVLWGGAAFLLASRDASKHSRLGDLALGGVLGLAYLTKGTGQLMLIGVILWKATLWFRPSATGSGPQQPRMMFGLALPVVLVLLGWGAVASPLLVRNVRMYGKPTYNVNDWLLFVDTFEQPVPLSKRQTLGEAARAYWESHTLADIVRREVSGLAWETFILLRMLGPCPLDDSRVLFGLPLALCALIGILARPRPEHLLLGYWTVLFVGVFAWYVPIAAGERFLLPLLAPFLICASEGLLVLVQTAGPRAGFKPPHVMPRGAGS